MLRVIFAMLALLVGLLDSFEAHAEVLNIAERQVDVKLPKGYCAAKANGHEAQIVDRTKNLVRPHNQLIMMFVNCNELLPKRLTINIGNDGFDDYGTLLLLTPNGQQPTPERGSRTAYLAATIEAAVKIPSIPEQYFKAAEKRLQEIRPGTTQNLGIIDKDENAIYIGMVYTVRDSNNETNRRYITVGGYTLVKNLKMTMNIVRRYKSVDDLRTTLAKSKENLARLVSANE